jgi:hypothetical protein
MIVVFVEFAVQLQQVSRDDGEISLERYQIQHRNLHHTLVKVGSPIFDHLDRNDLLSLQILTFHHLTKGSLPKHIENEVSIPGRRISRRLDPSATPTSTYLWPVSSEPSMSLT